MARRTRKFTFKVSYGPVSFDFDLAATVTISQLRTQVSLMTGVPLEKLSLQGFASENINEEVCINISLYQ